MTQDPTSANLDEATVAGFGDEWAHFDHANVSDAELRGAFEEYFAVFPWECISRTSVGFDLGCGSGRWARFVAPRVGTLHCIDASTSALAVARRNLAAFPNVLCHEASVAALPFAPASMDFGYSLGVLHHVPNTAAGIAQCVRLLKPGAPFLLYLYYAFDNRAAWYRHLWQLSEAGRHAISRLPRAPRRWVADAIAAGIYWPLARSARALERVGLDVSSIPLSAYRTRTFYAMRNDALDRFGTRLEQRFTRAQIRDMMHAAGLVDVRVHDGPPYWCAVGIAARDGGDTLRST